MTGVARRAFAERGLEGIMRVLLIGQDITTTTGVTQILTREKFVCDTREFGEAGAKLGKLRKYDIILLDLSSPDINGYRVLQELRRGHVHTPVLILSGAAGVDPRLKKFGVDADDVLTEPFDHGQLIGRIQTIVRRFQSQCESTIRTGKLIVKLNTRQVLVDDHSVHLTGKEYGILELLSRRKSSTLTKEMFLDHLYGGMDEPDLKIIDVFICKLRKKLAEATGGYHYIETVWGRGYRLRDPDTTEHPARIGKIA
jgi:two-component system cell cycle response regulator CtrA